MGHHKHQRALALAPVVALLAVAGAAAMPVLAQPNAKADKNLAQAVSTLDSSAGKSTTEFAIARQAEIAAETSRSANRVALAKKTDAARVARAVKEAQAAGVRGAWARERIRLKKVKAATIARQQRQARTQKQKIKYQRAQAEARLQQRQFEALTATRMAAKRMAAKRMAAQRTAALRTAERKAAQRKAAQREAAQREAAQRPAVQRNARPAPTGSPKAFAQTLVGSGAQYQCLVKLWERESGWNYRADNPSSDAYGIPQALPGSKMASAGADWSTNPQTQIRWGVGYIENRYGTPCAAWAHSERVNWY